MIISDVIQFAFNGLSLSGFYAIFAIGLALVFGVMKIVNFAHGELFMLGAFITWLVMGAGEGLLPLPVLFILSLIIAMLAIGGLGIALERGLFRPLKYELFGCYMATLQMMFVIRSESLRKSATIVFLSESARKTRCSFIAKSVTPR